MPRTTVDIDTSVLKKVKQLAARRGKTLGTMVSELLAKGLGAEAAGTEPQSFRWISKPMGAKVDLEDKEAVYRALERGDG